MKLSEYLNPALAVIAVVALGAGYYWFDLRSPPEQKETPSQALVIVTKSTNACFSDLVRVTGFVVPRREAVVGADQEGSKVTDLLVREGDTVVAISPDFGERYLDTVYDNAWLAEHGLLPTRPEHVPVASRP